MARSEPVAAPAGASATVTPSWLALREPADADARSVELLHLARTGTLTDHRMEIHDLGCGTAATARWLAPRLPGPQHWVLYDRSVDLLAVAASGIPSAGAGGGAITAETRLGDITRLGPKSLAGASLITASALLDTLTAEELIRIVALCIAADCPVLFGLSVVGRVTLSPADAMDELVAAAFNDHQRRATTRGRLLGPDAVRAAAEAFEGHGWQVQVRPSPWRLGAAHPALVAEWLTGWVAAACEQRPELTAAASGYARRRVREAAAGQLQVRVDHDDLLALPPATTSRR